VKRIILALIGGVLAGSAVAGFYTQYENYQSYKNNNLIFQGIIILHWIALLGAILIARPYASMERTEQIVPFVVIHLTAILTMGIWFFS